MLILGIETSCDETAVAVVSAENGNISMLSNIVSSQVKLHAKWGGVVPNLAAREHLKNMLPVLKESLKKAKVTPEKIDLIAVTQGPGLIPALLIGVDAAKTLSYIWKKPLMGIHHIEGHIYANFINSEQKSRVSEQDKLNSCSLFAGHCFPILCLVVSGGHTQLVLMKKHLSYEIIGETLDDAVGEAFDKVARILELGYPGGPAISEIASGYKPPASPAGRKNINQKLTLPRPMINSKDFNFSFSGLKTAVLYKVKAQKTINQELQTILAYEFQQASIDVLVSKTIRAAKKYNPKTIMLAGGVSANKELRKQLGKAIENNLPTVNYKLLTTNYSGDNAAMIAAAAYFRFQKIKNKSKLKNNWKNLEANAGLKLK
jgi:N6-L-threonylcarbamoyladenine synthase